MNRKDVLCTGSCFSEGTCFPSVTHVNGQSIDTAYLSLEKTQEFVNALDFFGFNSFYYKPKMKLVQPKNAIELKEDSGHTHHLHAGATSIKIKEIK